MIADYFPFCRSYPNSVSVLYIERSLVISVKGNMEFSDEKLSIMGEMKEGKCEQIKIKAKGGINGTHCKSNLRIRFLS